MKITEILQDVSEDDALGATPARITSPIHISPPDPSIRYNADTGTYTKTTTARGLPAPTHISPPDPSIRYNADTGTYVQTITPEQMAATTNAAPAPQPLPTMEAKRRRPSTS